jgi:hypothetical protein
VRCSPTTWGRSSSMTPPTASFHSRLRRSGLIISCFGSKVPNFKRSKTFNKSIFVLIVSKYISAFNPSYHSMVQDARSVCYALAGHKEILSMYKEIFKCIISWMSQVLWVHFVFAVEGKYVLFPDPVVLFWISNRLNEHDLLAEGSLFVPGVVIAVDLQCE